MTGIPPLTFAVVGHPNEGKSSVVSTLTEDDSVRITPIPGETVVCRAFPVMVDGRELVRFVDTPGFQSPLATLAWLQAHPGPDMLSDFMRQHAHDPAYAGECELFKPLAQNSQIIYVLDASRPLRSVDLAEMEILRMTGIPRMAIINNKDLDEQYVPAWRDELRKHFNAVRIFNAHRATYAERIALLNNLKSIDQEWEKPLGAVIQALEEDWLRRLNQTAWLIVRMIGQALSYQVSEKFPPEQEPPELRGNLTQAYREHITRLERETHLSMRKLFKHNIFDYRLPGQTVEGGDLFEERTWRMLGLSPLQVAAAGAVAGGGLGLGLDAVLGGASLGVFALAGGLIGAGTAFLGGKRMVTYEIKGPSLGRFQLRKPVGDYLLIVGPNKNPQFPFVLLDRALIFFVKISNWAHARRDTAPAGTHREGLAAHFDDAQTRISQSYFLAATAFDQARLQDLEEAMANMLVDLLRTLSNQDYQTGGPPVSRS